LIATGRKAWSREEFPWSACTVSTLCHGFNPSRRMIAPAKGSKTPRAVLKEKMGGHRSRPDFPNILDGLRTPLPGLARSGTTRPPCRRRNDKALDERQLAGARKRSLVTCITEQVLSTLLSFKGDGGTCDLRFVVEKGTEFLEDEIEFCTDDDIVTIGAHTLQE